MVCCVVDCPNKLNMSPKCRCYPFPSTNCRSEKLKELSRKRRNAWIRSLRIISPNAKVLHHQRVCYLHFIQGFPAKLSEDYSPDWVPNQKLGVGENKVCEIALKRTLRRSKKHVKVLQENSNVVESLEISENESFGGDGYEYDEPNIEFLPVTSAPECQSSMLNTVANKSQQSNVKIMFLNPAVTSSSGLEVEEVIAENNNVFIREKNQLSFIQERSSMQNEVSLEKLRLELIQKEEIIKSYEQKEKEAEVKHKAIINTFEQKVKEYDVEIKKLKLKFRIHDISFESLKNDEEKVKNLTGLPNFALLNKLYEVVKNDLSEYSKTKVNKFDSFVITLMKLRLDLPISYLSYTFGLSALKMSKMYRENLVTMNEKIGPLVKWPSDEALLLNTPSCFKEIMGNKCIVLVHFLEILIKNLKSSNTGIQSMKHKIKYLVAFTAAGEIIYVSQGFGSSASNEHVIGESGFFDKISEQHIVLSVKDMFEESQKNNEQIQSIKNMAKNTEDKVLDILRDNFRILFNRQPVNSNGEVYSEYTVRCCCALANLLMPELSVDNNKEAAETVVVHTKQDSQRGTLVIKTKVTAQEEEIL